MRIHDVVVSKCDEADEDCEDRLAFVTDGTTESIRAAVADGAAATAFSGEWAELLVKAFCERAFADWDDFAMRLKDASQLWVSDVYSKTRPWHALIRAQSGGAAAIAGIEIFASSLQWSAVALGDSCIFQLRDGRIHFALPAYGVDQFDSHPRLMSTDAAKNVGLSSVYETASGRFESGDCFLLATDAASEAIVRAGSIGDGLHEWLHAIGQSPEAARKFIEKQRDQGAIRNDDVALILIEV